MVKTKYRMIADDLIKKIQMGIFEKGDRIYSQSEIMELYNVSSTTAIKALIFLSQANYTYSVQGKGTFVSKANRDELVLLSDFDPIMIKSERVVVKEIKEQSTKDILEKLEMKSGESYYKFVRIKYSDTVPSDVMISFVRSEFVKPEMIKNKENFISIYSRFKIDFEIDPYELSYNQQDTMVEIFDRNILSYFEYDKPSFLLKQNRTTRYSNNKIIEYIISYKAPKFFGISIKSLE